MTSWVSSDDDDDFVAAFERREVRAATVFDLSPESDDGDDYDAEYLERTSHALAHELTEVDDLLYAPDDGAAEAEFARASMQAASAPARSRPNIDRDTGLVIPHGTSAATERLAECLRWRRAGAHLRAVGTQVVPPDGWEPLPEVDPRAIATRPKQPSAAGADAHYALGAMLVSGAVAARNSLSVVGTAAPLARLATMDDVDDDGALDPAGEEVLAAHGSVDEVFALDAQTDDDRRWAAARPELSHEARQRRALERWGLPPLSPELDDERLDAAAREVWRAMAEELEPHLFLIGEALFAAGQARAAGASGAPALESAVLSSPAHCAQPPPALAGEAPSAPRSGPRELSCAAAPTVARGASAPQPAPADTARCGAWPGAQQAQGAASMSSLSLELPARPPRAARALPHASGALPGAKLRRKAAPNCPPGAPAPWSAGACAPAGVGAAASAHLPCATHLHAGSAAPWATPWATPGGARARAPAARASPERSGLAAQAECAPVSPGLPHARGR